MKIASILAGVAVAAMTATSASAGEINQGQFTLQGLGFPIAWANGTHDAPLTIPGTNIGLDLGANKANAKLGGSQISSWHATGQSGDNKGSVLDTGAATFTLTGKVDKDCAYYTGNSEAHTLAFGTIGIYADENAGPANMFTMTSAASVEINSNVAGCNTANTVKITKTDMVSDNTGGYDSNVFTNKLPFKVVANYKAGAAGSPAAVTGATDQVTVPANLPGGQASHGAWKSPMSLKINIDQQQKALLAGNYSGTVTVLISAS